MAKSSAVILAEMQRAKNWFAWINSGSLAICPGTGEVIRSRKRSYQASQAAAWGRVDAIASQNVT